MLYSIEHSPEKVLPEFKSFAESAARTIYSRTKQEIPRDLPWHVRPRGDTFRNPYLYPLAHRFTRRIQTREEDWRWWFFNRFQGSMDFTPNRGCDQDF